MDGMRETGTAGRGAGIVLGLATLMQVVLLAAHPGNTSHDFAGMIREEAASRLVDALVHGGFIVVLIVQLAIYVSLSLRLDAIRTVTIAAVAFFAAGCAFLSGSLFVDGLVVPSLAARYVAATPPTLSSVRPVFAALATAIQWLMPLGLGFQGFGIALWGFRLVEASPITGALTLLLAALILAGVAAAFALSNGAIIMAAFVGTILWSALAASWLVRGRVQPVS